MMLKDLINKIKWDKKEKPELYSLFYIDRFTKKKKEIKYNNLKRIEGTFLVIEQDSEEIEIPMHRIKEARKEGKLIWSRSH